jgi:hypothetical protein
MVEIMFMNRRRLRAIGTLVLLLGFVGAGLVYWTGAPPEDLSDDMLTPDNSKKAARDIEVNFGKMGLLMVNLSDDLRQPGTQAALIVVVSILLASGCFYLAGLPGLQAGSAAADAGRNTQHATRNTNSSASKDAGGPSS